MPFEGIIAAALLAGVGGWMITRFVRPPTKLAREHDAGAHLWMFTTGWYSGPHAILSQSRHARVDVYARALVLTPLAMRMIIPRAGIRELAREAEGGRRFVRGTVSRLETSSHGTVAIAMDDATHERLQVWLSEPD